jgi:hypothetical protein
MGLDEMTGSPSLLIVPDPANRHGRSTLLSSANLH